MDDHFCHPGRRSATDLVWVLSVWVLVLGYHRHHLHLTGVVCYYLMVAVYPNQVLQVEVAYSRNHRVVLHRLRRRRQ